ncbi:MAG: 23S rRNA (adenine(2503)-C(2))-methyltransferase RlmN [Oscillospiraceae bacterium]|nr:23S rRNA (adenine(2503)-C(2))-methyltransferase RlmN [Oscillospiraceae bacterium]
MIDIRSMTQSELEEYILSIGQPKFRAAQVYLWLHKGIASFDEMKNIPKALRELLAANCTLNNAEIVRCQKSKTDGTRKYLFKFSDGNCVESVFMKYNHGNTVCLSTQVGCRMGCVFCASTKRGLVRNLVPSEMLAELYAIIRDTGEKISNIVLMGTGEPLDNYDNVIKFLHLVNDERGLNIGMRHISLSTCGICEKISRLADENLPLTLSVSLHAPNDVARSAIMPINKAYGVKRLVDECRKYFEKTSRRISFEYTTIAGKTDGAETAKELAELLSGFPCHVNLIPLNKISEGDLSPSSPEAIKSFMSYLEQRGITVTVRRSLGADIDAACGQLRQNYISE